MSDRYLGATESELRDAPGPRRLAGYIDQRTLFPHEGLLRLEAQTLELEGWRDIPRSAVAGVRLTFTPAYTRWQAAGVRGNNASFGLFGSLGKPLVLTMHRDEPVYLLIGYRWTTGINDSRKWFPRLRRWIDEGVTVP